MNPDPITGLLWWGPYKIRRSGHAKRRQVSMKAVVCMSRTEAQKKPAQTVVLGYGSPGTLIQEISTEEGECCVPEGQERRVVQ